MLEHIRSLGCQDERKVIMTYHTFLELSEVEERTNLTCNYNADLDVLYISENQPNNINVYVAVHSSFTFSPSWIKKVQDVISPNNPKSIILVIREGDSTFVRYKLTSALISQKLDFKYKEKSKIAEFSDDEPEVKKIRTSPQPGCSTDL